MPDNQESPSKELEQKGGDMSNKLLDCPFCGEPAANISLCYDIWVIECGIACCSQSDYNKEECIRLWNTRAPSPQLTATQQALDSSCQTNEVLAKRLVMCRKFFESISRLTTRLDLLDEEIRLRVFNEVESALSTIEGK